VSISSRKSLQRGAQRPQEIDTSIDIRLELCYNDFMLNEEMVPGKTYKIRLTNGTWTEGVFLRELENKRYSYNSNFSYFSFRRNTHYIFTNVRTGRKIEIKSKQRIKAMKVA
jgi:hypothetical protein